jgi:DinB superfamily
MSGYERIRGYLKAQAAKLEPPAIVDKVRAAMADLRAAAARVPPARFAERPAPEEWSGNEVMAHVVDAGRFFGGAIVAALDGGPVPSPARERAPASDTRTAEAWLATLTGDRDALFARVARAAPSERLDITIEHFMFGPLNWRETLLFMRLHDLDHAGQLDKIATALTARPPT